MAHLTDMEELLSLIRDDNIKDYMKEAMLAYMAGSYRSCIILSYIATFDYLFKNLENIKTHSQEANNIYKNIDSKRKEHKTFENDIVEQLNKERLISSMDYKDLKRIIDLRNDAAHPSGRKPSAEEARYIFSSVIKKFLSKLVVSDKIQVDLLIKRIKQKNFFIDNDVSNTIKVVSHELKKLHNVSYKILIPQLVKAFDIAEDEDNDQKVNIGRFLGGLFLLHKNNDEDINQLLLTEIIIKKNLEDSWSDRIVTYLTMYAELFEKIKSIDKKEKMVHFDRIKKILYSNCQNIPLSFSETMVRHPINVLRKIHKTMNTEEFMEEFEDLTMKTIKKFKHAKNIVSLLTIHTDFFDYYFAIVINMASNSNNKESNKFILELENYSNILINMKISDKKSFMFLSAIYEASLYDHPPSMAEAEKVVNESFLRISELKEKAVRYMNTAETTDIINIMRKHGNEERYADFLNVLKN